MSTNLTPFLVFACLFGGALLGMGLRAVLPEQHLSAETKDTVRVGMSLIATMAALVLGLLVASTKGAYDTDKSEVVTMASKIIYLDQVLENYGPNAAGTRQVLRQAVARAINVMWPEDSIEFPNGSPSGSAVQTLPVAIQNLPAETDAQRAFKAEAAQVATDLGQMRWLLFEQSESSISWPMLVIVTTWLAIIFTSVGLFAPSNATVTVSLLLAALSVAGAIFLILELDLPFEGLIHISSEPMRNALAQISH
jgi:hypothetical protein